MMKIHTRFFRTICEIRPGWIVPVGLILLSLLFNGCLFRPGLEEPLPALSLGTVWKRFQTVQPDVSLLDQGCRLKASLNIFSPQQSHRISLELWGNYALPLRLNLSAGFGRALALWRVDQNQWLGYVPQQQQAYTHPDSRVGIQRMGMDSPFDIQELLFLLTGQWKALIPSTFQGGRYLEGQGYLYQMAPNDRFSELLLDRSGLPRVLRGGSDNPWQMQFSEYVQQEGRLIPLKIHLRNAEQEEVLIRIKSLELARKPWDDAKLELNLPGDTDIVPLNAL